MQQRAWTDDRLDEAIAGGAIRQSLYVHGKALRSRDRAVSVSEPVLPRAAGEVYHKRSDWVRGEPVESVRVRGLKASTSIRSIRFETQGASLVSKAMVGR
jgi:hypothetical protein